MKRIFLSALIGVGMVALIFPPFSGRSAARTAQAYPLVCRGGGIIVPGKAPGVGNIGFTFTRGKRPAGEGLDPGVCSWVDRGMYDTEPSTVSQHVEEVEGTPENKWYDELHRSDRYWTFMVSNNGRGELIATSARPSGGVGGADVSPKTTGFTPASDGAKTWEWVTSWANFKDFSAAIDTSIYFPKVPGQITAGFLHHWDGGHWPLPNQERKTVEFVGTVWFDLGEIFSKPSMPKAEYAMLTFKAIESDGPGGVCKDELRLPSDDWMRGLPANTLPKTGSLEPAVYFTGCPPAGCSFEVTSIVNNWITGREDRYGFAISGLDDIAAIGTDGGKNPDNNAHCTTRYGDFRLTVNYRYDKALPTLSACKNVALASNGGVATALSTFPGSEPGVVIDGDRRGAGKAGTWASATKDFPTWIEVAFSGSKSITEINVFTKQDDLASPVEPTETTTFSKYGLTEFEVQYWFQKFGTWKTIPGGHVSGNKLVWRKFKFPAITTSKIRILSLSSPDSYSRITELEACGN